MPKLRPGILVPAFLTLQAAGLTCLQAQETETLPPGLRVRYEAGQQSHTSSAPNAWLINEAGGAVSPFVTAGAFTVVWEGYLNIDLRDRYTFSADLLGELKVEVGEEVVLEASGQGERTEKGKRVRLSKGANPIRITLKSLPDGKARLRLLWESPDIRPEPIPSEFLTHEKSPEQTLGQSLEHGRGLSLEFRCFQCHDELKPALALPESSLDAPTFEGMGSRRQTAFLAEWIQNPQAIRPMARMPRVLHGDGSRQEAQDMAAYLGSLKGSADATTKGNPVKGADLFSTLHCGACHVTAGQPAEEGKLSLSHVRAKFSEGSLAAFLQQPEKHYQWIRMPNFGLTPEEASHLAAHLEKGAPEAATPHEGSVERGRKLVAEKGCLQCHTGPDSKDTTRRNVSLSDRNGGCLDPASKAPQFGLSDSDREALKTFLGQRGDSLKQHVPAEFAHRQTQNLRCTDCHGRFEGFPTLPILGGKLHPEWMTRFLGGKIPEKPRPWIGSRMPAFPSRAEGLAVGLAASHGYPAQTPEEPAIDPEQVAIGRKLVSSDGGFSCVACHAVGEFAATQVFESAGINLAWSADRLQKDFYKRWLMNPLRIDPITKMPVYFDRGESPLYDYFDGNADKQLDALWHYLRMGSKMPLPLDAGNAAPQPTGGKPANFE